MSRLFSFPNPVNELSARLVAGGVVAMGTAYVVTGWTWLLIPITYGFIARVLSGPRWSPLGLFVTRVLTPRLDRGAALVPGPPKRFAQGMGTVFAVGACLLVVTDHTVLARLVIAALVGAAGLEAFVGFCSGCWIFARLMRAGIVSETVCPECSDISIRRPTAV